MVVCNLLLQADCGRPNSHLSRRFCGTLTSRIPIRRVVKALGNVFTAEITETFIARPFINFGTDSRLVLPDDYSPISSFTDFFRYSFGQIADEIVDEEPRFDGTSVTVFFYDSESSARGLLVQGFGGITTGQPDWIDEVPQATDDTGPFWLFRTAAIPEPTSIILMANGAIAVFSTRNRHR